MVRIALSSSSTIIYVAAAFSLAALTCARADCPNLLGKWEAPRIVNGISTHAKTVPTQNGVTPDCSYAWAGARPPKPTVNQMANTAPPPAQFRK